MKKLVRLSLPALALLSLSSCALPPREAWRVIQHDGLIPYIAVEMGRKPVPKYVRLPNVAASRFVNVTSGPKAPRSVAFGGDVFVMRPPWCLPPTRYLDRRVVAAPKPPRVVAAPRVAARPTPPASARPVAAVAPKPAPHPVASAPVVRPVKPVEAKVAVVPPKPPAPPAVKPLPPPASPPPVKPAANAVVTVKPVVPGELPFGTPIPGRPGLVNSPFAGKYQLVDVTGLSPGQEVKCPYSGKLFRVPGVQQATNAAKVPAEPPPPPAKKADDEKKP